MELLPDKSLLPQLDLDVELFERNNISVAYLVIISGLLKNFEQRTEILEKMKPIYINVPFNRYLYEIVVDEINKKSEVNVDSILSIIPDFGPRVYNNLSDEHSLRGEYFTFAQIMDFEPTKEQVSKAIDMAVRYAQKRGVAS